MEALLYILKSAVILSLFYIVYRIVLQKDTFFVANRHYLIAGIIAAFIFPFIQFTKTIYLKSTAIVDTASMYNEVPLTAIETIPSETITINWWSVALVIYCVGVCIMLIRLGTQLFSLSLLIKKYPATRTGKYTYVQVHDNITPFSFFRTICYNPQLHTTSELKMILEHEKIHAHQWHTIDVLLTQIVLALQWMNPIAWFYKRSLEQNLEFLADNGAIQKVVSSKEYQHTLVKVSSTSLRPALTNNFYHSLIKKRIVMLNKQTSHKRNLWKLGLILPVLALFMYSFNVKTKTEFLPLEKSLENPVTYNETLGEASIIDPIEEDTSAFAKAETTNTISPKPKPNLAITPLKRASIKKEESPVISTTTPKQQILLPQPASVVPQNSEEFRIKITKSSTETELLKIKKDLMEKHQIDFSYTTVRNEKQEIIALKIQYTTATNNNGNYNVSSDGPISDIYFYQEADGAIGLGNARSSEEAKAMMEERFAARKIHLEERKQKMEEHREEMKAHREKLRMQMKEHRSEARSEMGKHEERMKERQHKMKERVKEREKRQYERVHEQSRRRYHSQHALEINKDTTDEEIKIIKKKLEEKGISFSFSKVKRNSAGEITAYRMSFDDNKGTESSTKRKSSDSPMEPLQFVYDGNTLRINN